MGKLTGNSEPPINFKKGLFNVLKSNVFEKNGFLQFTLFDLNLV